LNTGRENARSYISYVKYNKEVVLLLGCYDLPFDKYLPAFRKMCFASLYAPRSKGRQLQPVYTGSHQQHFVKKLKADITTLHI